MLDFPEATVEGKQTKAIPTQIWTFSPHKVIINCIVFISEYFIINHIQVIVNGKVSTL
jgi:hypothetical protein